MKWLILQKATPTLRVLSVGVAFWDSGSSISIQNHNI